MTTCAHCSQPRAAHYNGNECRFGHDHAPTTFEAGQPTPKAKPMKSKLEILREIVEHQITYQDALASTVVGTLPASGAHCSAQADALRDVLCNIVALQDGPAPDAGDDHGAALALVTAERDGLNEDVRQLKYLAKLHKSGHEARERETVEWAEGLTATLASVEGERDKYRNNANAARVAANRYHGALLAARIRADDEACEIINKALLA